jgi:acetyl esterase/lipase
MFTMIAAAAVLSGCATVFFHSVGVLSGHSAQITPDIVFDPSHGLKLDVYRPAGAEAAPVVVFLYGGAWTSGQRDWYRYAGEALSSHGIVVVIPDYRKSPQVHFPDFVDDAARGVAWARANAVSYGGDPKRLFVMGHSAGAHIGALLATDGRFLARVNMKPRDLAGFIGLAGPYDFAPFTDDYLVTAFGSELSQQQAAMPANYIDGDEPPMLLLQGLSDNTVWPRNTRSMADKLTAKSEPVETKFYPAMGHTRIALSLSPPFSGKTTTLADTLDFIRRH